MCKSKGDRVVIPRSRKKNLEQQAMPKEDNELDETATPAWPEVTKQRQEEWSEVMWEDGSEPT